MMNVDFEKLFKLLLPTFMRGGLNELLKSIAYAFTSLYAYFRSWQTDMRLQAAITCQVMYLELILNYRLLGTFNRIINITDGDGVETDFVINQPEGVDVDSYRLIALLDKYKTYGKRYLVQQRQYIYNNQWSGFVCEQEHKRSILPEFGYDGYLWVQTHDYVTSTIVIRVLIDNSWTHDFTIEKGTNISGLLRPGDNVADFQSWSIVSVSPQQDEYSIYVDGESYLNSGFQRASTLTIEVLFDGIIQSTSVFPLMEAFTYNSTTYPAVNSTQIAQMPEADYTARVTAYAAYVTANYQSQYPGLEVTAADSRVQNITACPIN